MSKEYKFLVSYFFPRKLINGCCMLDCLIFTPMHFRVKKHKKYVNALQ